MSWLGPILDGVSDAIEAYGASYVRAMLPSIIRIGIGSGLSGSSILRDLRSAGVGVRTQRFYQMLGELQSSDAGAETVSAMGLTDIPSAEDFSNWGVRNPSGYVYQFRMYIGDTMEDGRIIPAGYRNFSLRSGVIQAIGDIMQDAIDLFRGQAVRYGQTFLGAELVNLYQEVELQ